MPVRRKAALLLLLALIAGCEAPETEARTLPPVTAAPVASAAPAAATPAGAVAFARHYFAEITRAFATKDPSLVSSLSAPGCETCKRFTDSLTELRDKSSRVTPVVFEIRFAEAPSSDGRTARVDLQYDFSGSRWYDAADQLVFEEKPARRTVTVSLTWIEDAWRVAGIR